MWAYCTRRPTPRGGRREPATTPDFKVDGPLAVDGNSIAASDRLADLDELDRGGCGLHEHSHRLAELGDRVARSRAKDREPLTGRDVSVGPPVDGRV